MSHYWIESARRRRSGLEPETLETKVVGVTYDNRQQIIRQLALGERLWLRREPKNPHDTNAIRVERANGQQIGYLARGLAQSLACTFDEVGGVVPAIVKAIIGGQYAGSSLGVYISFQPPEHSGRDPGPISIDGFTADDF